VASMLASQARSHSRDIEIHDANRNADSRVTQVEHRLCREESVQAPLSYSMWAPRLTASAGMRFLAEKTPVWKPSSYN